MTINYLNCQWNKHVPTFLSLLLVQDALRFTRPRETVNFSSSLSPLLYSQVTSCQWKESYVPQSYVPQSYLCIIRLIILVTFYTQSTGICTSHRHFFISHCAFSHFHLTHCYTKVQSQSIKESYAYLLVSGQESAILFCETHCDIHSYINSRNPWKTLSSFNRRKQEIRRHVSSLSLSLSLASCGGR